MPKLREPKSKFNDAKTTRAQKVKRIATVDRRSIQFRNSIEAADMINQQEDSDETLNAGHAIDAGSSLTIEVILLQSFVSCKFS